MPLPIEEHYEFSSDDSEQHFALFTDEIQASVSRDQQNLEEIIAKRKAKLFEFERTADAATIGGHGRGG